MIKAVIFDFDHTLYDRKNSLLKTIPFLMEGLKEYLRIDITEQEFSDALLYGETAEGGYYENGYNGVCNLLDQQGVFAKKPEPDAYRNIFYSAFNNGITPFSDTYETLQELKDQGYLLAVLTNGFTKIQHEKLSYTRVPSYMDDILVSEESGRNKPHPLPFLTICRRLGLRTDEAVYVGDNIICDVCGARGAGLKTIWFPFAREWPVDMPSPDYVIQSLSEIPGILNKLKQN